jgi:hypothetical protein
MRSETPSIAVVTTLTMTSGILAAAALGAATYAVLLIAGAA